MTDDRYGAPVFPCPELPQDPAQRRLLGLYPQRQEGLFMQRVKVPGGALEPAQWLALADCCERFTPGEPLLITTRQDIEFHNVTAETVPKLQRALAAAALSGLGSCGDTLRNITLCPGGGLTAGTADLRPVAGAVWRELMGFRHIFNLPRKFKINFSGCAKACGQPWINDLAFVARQNGGGFFLRVIGAGSLGPRPLTGMVLREELDPAEAPAFALAALSFFSEQGDREHRGKARLRHVRERLGDAEFLKRLGAAFDAIRSTIAPRPGPGAARACRRAGLLTFPCGCLEPAHARAIAETGFISRLQNHHRIALYAEGPEVQGNQIADHPMLGKFSGGLDIVACPGTTWCDHGIINTHALERELRLKLPKDFDKKIRISGCPNGCAHSGVADIGLLGRLKKNEGGQKCEGVRVLTGGGMGITPALAAETDPFVPVQEVPEKLLRLFG